MEKHVRNTLEALHERLIIGSLEDGCNICSIVTMIFLILNEHRTMMKIRISLNRLYIPSPYCFGWVVGTGSTTCASHPYPYIAPIPTLTFSMILFSTIRFSFIKNICIKLFVFWFFSGCLIRQFVVLIKRLLEYKEG